MHLDVGQMRAVRTTAAVAVVAVTGGSHVIVVAPRVTTLSVPIV